MLKYQLEIPCFQFLSSSIVSSFLIFQSIFFTPTSCLKIDYNLVPGASQILTHFINNTEFLDSFLDHGCWCAKLSLENRNVYGLGGRHPVDNLDTICKQWAQDRSCTRLSGSACDEDENFSEDLVSYELEYFTSVNDAYCPDSNSCLSESCQIDLSFVKSVIDFLETSFSESYFSTVSNSVCVEPGFNENDFTRTKEVPSYCSLITTTISPETTTTDICQNVVSDVIFVLDGSTSVSAENYENAIDFVKKVIEPLSVSDTSTRIALVQYATISRVEFSFQTDKNTTYEKLDQVEQIYGATFTGKAIGQVVSDLVDVSGRADANPVIVLITDGLSFDNVVPNALEFESRGGELFVIGVGDAFEGEDSFEKLSEIASVDPDSEDGEKFLWINDWSGLATITENIGMSICSQ